jgi:hypothetical protein
LIAPRRFWGWLIGKRGSEGRPGRGYRGWGDGEGMSKRRDVAVIVLVPPVSSLVLDIAVSGLPLHLDLDSFCVLVCLLRDRCLMLLGAPEPSKFGFGVYGWRRRGLVWWWLRCPRPVLHVLLFEERGFTLEVGVLILEGLDFAFEAMKSVHIAF